jgi:hypothetical protein
MIRFAKMKVIERSSASLTQSGDFFNKYSRNIKNTGKITTLNPPSTILSPPSALLPNKNKVLEILAPMNSSDQVANFIVLSTRTINPRFQAKVSCGAVDLFY